MTIVTIVVGEFQVNCSVIWGESKQAIIVDPGGDIEQILAFLDKEDLQVAAYMMTHGHMDHISGLAALHAARPAPIGLHPKDREWAFTELNQMLPFYGTPDEPAQIERELADGQVWEDGGMTYSVIDTPGHTPGGVCFLFEAGKALIVGDTLFAGSVGRTDLPGGDSRVLKQSLRRLTTLDESLTVYPGHGPTTTLAHEKRTNFFMQN
jgi:hydroxyacylglutathione hydrolase